MRRTSEPRVSTTKPVTSPSAVPAVAVTVSVPGAATSGCVTIVASPCWTTTLADHGSGPPPASVTVTTRDALAPDRNSPNDSPLGDAKINGAFARGTSTMPPPSRVVGTSWPAALCTGSAVWTSADLTSATVQSGWRSSSSATAPATCGVAMLVPLSWPHVWLEVGSDETTLTPGAVTSGFICSETGVGPADEKPAIASVDVAAATVIASGAFPGEVTVPLPKLVKSFPAATTGTTPAAAAPSSARTTMSREGSTSGSPIERLITFIPSETAASIAAAISAAFPSRPSPGVGIVRAL